MEKEEKKIKIQFNNSMKYYKIGNDSNYNDLKKFCKQNFLLKSFRNYYFVNNCNNEKINKETNLSTLINATLLLKEKKELSKKGDQDISQQNNDGKDTNEMKLELNERQDKIIKILDFIHSIFI